MTDMSFDPELLDELQENVNRGVQLLDVEYPGWHRRVDPNRLDMASCYSCTLSQLLHRGYSRAFRQLFPSTDIKAFGTVAELHGFITHAERDNAYGALTSLWRGVIVQRQLQEGQNHG